MRKPPLKRFPQYYSGRKETLTIEEMDFLLSHAFIVEEKIDGSITIEEYEHILYGKVYLMLEDMKYVHTVFYDNLPARFILVDVCKEDGSRLRLDEREVISIGTGYPLPPLIMVVNRMISVDAARFIDFIAMDLKSGFTRGIKEGFVIKSEADLNLGGKWSSLNIDDAERFDKSKTNHIRGHKHPM